VVRKSISLFLSVVMLFIPLIVNAQEIISEEKAKAVEQAEADAEIDVNTAKWMMSGCLLNYLAVEKAHKSALSPDPSGFLGKSPEYVKVYTKAYKEKAQAIQARYAMVGCFIISTISAVVVIIAVKKVSSCLSDFEGFTIFPSCGFGK